MTPAIASAVLPAMTPAKQRRAAWLALWAFLKGAESLLAFMADRVLERAHPPDAPKDGDA